MSTHTAMEEGHTRPLRKDLVNTEVKLSEISYLQASKHLQKRERGEKINSYHTLTKINISSTDSGI